MRREAKGMQGQQREGNGLGHELHSTASVGILHGAVLAPAPRPLAGRLYDLS